MCKTYVLLGLMLGFCLTGAVSAAEWGDLKMRFVYDGSVPKPMPVNVTKDQAFCGKHKLVDETLIVNPINGGIKDVVVYVYVGRGKDAPEIHESYAKTADGEVRLDNKDCRYEPHIALLRTSQTLVIGNKDPVGHNTKVDALFNTAINPIIPAGGELKHSFDLPERIPVPVGCNIHPWMNARLLVQDHPYMAASDENGEIEINNLPAGELTFQVWQERAGFLSDVKLDGKKTKWSKGRVDLKIKSGSNDLGDVEVPASAFKD